MTQDVAESAEGSPSRTFAPRVLIVIIGLYLASQPELYSGGIKRLLPGCSRDRAGEVLAVIDEAWSRWLIARFGLILPTMG